MGTPSKYWQLVSLDISGDSRIHDIVLIKEFFQQQLPELANQVEVADTLVQRELLAYINGDRQSSDWGTPVNAEVGPRGILNPQGNADLRSVVLQRSNGDKLINTSLMADRSLRCFISHQIRQVCIQLEFQFGREHDFTRRDLFPLVLDDTLDNFRDFARKTQKSIYKPLAVEIIETFEPKKASLSTWITRKVKQHKELSTFLLEHGVYLVSNWAILNDTNLKQVNRILSEFHHLTPVEIKQACFVLESYHAIYRRDRLQNREKTRVTTKCPPPTTSQLEQIAILLSQKTQLTLTPEETLVKIQELAALLREYRIYVRAKGFKNQKSLDEPEIKQKLLSETASTIEGNEQEEFSQAFKQQFQKCLAHSLEYVVQNRFNYLERKKPDKAKKFLIALELFHCQGKSMGKIAPIVGLKAQFEVTRLLKLKEFRQDVAQKMLTELGDRTLSIAANYQDSEALKKRAKQIEIALEQQIGMVIQEAEKEASIADSVAQSLFVQCLCAYLHQDR